MLVILQNSWEALFNLRPGKLFKIDVTQLIVGRGSKCNHCHYISYLHSRKEQH